MAIRESQAKYPLALISLGKFGDLCNGVAIAYHFSKEHNPVPFFCCAQYLSLFLGTDYIQAIPIRLSPTKIELAMQIASERTMRLINLQTFGLGYSGPFDKPHNERQFIAAGLPESAFHDLDAFPLVYNRRDVERENFLYRTHVKTSKPLMLLALSCSRSSPFPAHHIMIESLRRRWEKLFEIVDLCRINAPRLYDMIGLLERAAMLITSDGSLLHLSAAVPMLPLIYLVGDNRLTAAAARQAPALTVKYSEWHRRMGEIHGVIQARVHPGSATP